MSVGRQIALKPQSHGRVCSEICKMLNSHVGIVPKRNQKLQTVDCWSRNRKSCVNRLIYKNLRVFTQISRSPIFVFFLPGCRSRTHFAAVAFAISRKIGAVLSPIRRVRNSMKGCPECMMCSPGGLDMIRLSWWHFWARMRYRQHAVVLQAARR